MKLINKDFIKVIQAEPGKMLISKHDKELLQQFNTTILPGLSPIYYKEISAPLEYTEEEMFNDFIEEDKEEADV